ncbi:MAG TPA: hypothetical protein GX747_03860 [Tenericutes bacterium]|nr:hypothetical protein [Mycoplasmatota bacterium]
MKESLWAIMIVILGLFCIGLIYFFQSVTNTDEHNYILLKETTEAAMLDAVDLATYRKTGQIRIDTEKFVENFSRRFAQNANLARTYRIEIYDVVETPPKVSLQVLTSESTTSTGELLQFNIANRLDAILETPY